MPNEYPEAHKKIHMEGLILGINTLYIYKLFKLFPVVGKGLKRHLQDSEAALELRLSITQSHNYAHKSTRLHEQGVKTMKQEEKTQRYFLRLRHTKLLKTHSIGKKHQL